MSLIAVDLGNTNIVIGRFEGETLDKVWRISTHPHRTSDEYAMLIKSFGISEGQAPIICSSVVPQLSSVLGAALRELFSSEVLFVGPGTKTGMPLKVREPAAVGADRVVNALAAKKLYGCPGIVIDFGTATSFDLVDSEGRYRGGAIAPGPKLALEALVSKAAKLPNMEFVWPESAIGTDTVTAMRSGAVLGYHHLVEGLLEQIESDLGEKFKFVVATGGLGELFAENSERISHYEANLTLLGLRLIWEMNS